PADQSAAGPAGGNLRRSTPRMARPVAEAKRRHLHRHGWIGRFVDRWIFAVLRDADVRYPSAAIWFTTALSSPPAARSWQSSPSPPRAPLSPRPARLRRAGRARHGRAGPGSWLIPPRAGS